MRQIVLRLLHQPAFGATPEYFRKPDSHFGRYATFLVHELRERGACDSQGCRRVGDAQAERLEALTQHEASGVRRILHRHGSNPFQ